MQQDHKQLCPVCHIEMQFHALKAEPPKPSGRLKTTASGFFGVLEAFHSCPKCGRAVTNNSSAKA
jgi:hypothetical protein